MPGDSPVSLLMFGTIGIVLLVAIFVMVRFIRKPANRHPMDGQPERNIDEIREDAGVTSEDSGTVSEDDRR